MLPTPSIKRPASIEDLLDNDLIARVSQLDLASTKIFAGKLRGERRSKKRGESVEFADHRPYAIGDDTRHIDWNILARLDRLFLKLFLEEEDLSLHLVLDASLSSDCGEPNKFVFMQRVAMTLGYIGLVNFNRVAGSVFGGAPRSTDQRAATSEPDSAPLPRSVPSSIPLHAIRDLRGRRRVHDLARFLCSIEPAGDTDFRESAMRIVLSRRGRGVMVVLSDFLMKEGYQDGLRLLVGRGYDVFALQVLSPQEVEPPVRGDLRLTDIEDSATADVTISAPLLKRYRQVLHAYQEELRTFCAQREIALLCVQSNTPIETLVVEYLRRRGLLR
ncbi:MAG: DUF58 domain-containing protein [Phycisphaeraceae bacterium]|nr:DUF58 domain-containing protein [Phycisphaeraceae bacterium]